MAYTTINKSTDYFNTKLYTGNGSSQSITGIGHQPDFTWIKSRSSTAFHLLTDAVRGVTKQLYSNSSTSDNTNSYHITSFNSDGFSVGSAGDVNGNGTTFASWNWKANGAGSSNTDGSITSTVSANTTSGFSIVSWTGDGNLATIGHGLGVTPSMYIVKNRSITEDWLVYHKDLTSNNDPPEDLHLTLNSNSAVANYPVWNDTAPTSSVFTVNNYAGTNGNGNNMIAYCFAEKTGYSKFGSYSGNGSTDGAFVYTGFKPAFVMIKRTGGTQDWIILDNKRPEYNETNRALYPNANYDDTDTGKGIDILSNGFKLRKNHEAINYSENYIYMAFGQSLVGNNNVPATAR